MKCSILGEDSYINDVTRKIPIWVAEGQKELSDNRTTWEWIKYNIRAHVVQGRVVRKPVNVNPGLNVN